MPPRYRKKDPTPQHYPSWIDLLSKIDSGLAPRKEVRKRIAADEIPSELEDPEQFEAYEQVILLGGGLI